MVAISEKLEDHVNGISMTPLNAVGGTSAQEFDALIVGAGFGGVFQLKKLRDLGYNVLLVESGSDYGGVWYWNRYPGARVDTAAPQYQFSDPAIWKTFSYSQRFPGSAEIRAYFSHVAKKWDLRKDTKFNTHVEAASWDDLEGKWTVTTGNGYKFKVKYFLMNTGFAAKRYIPDWKGIASFKGVFIHPSYWPHEEPDLRGKKIAIIGTGATGVQLSQDLSKVAGQLTVFQRTPNTAMPMRQIDYDDIANRRMTDAEVEKSLQGRIQSFGGFDYNFLPRSTFDDPPEERLKIYEELWKEGSFKYMLATYQDMLFQEDANREAYNFWRDRVREKLHEPKVADILAPMKQEYAFGCKRVPLENGFYEVFNESHVRLVNVNATPIEEITEKGIRTSAEEMEFDYIICATGFDSLTGGLTQIDIRGKDGKLLRDYWKDGAKTYLGMAVHGFPNLFFTYGPQAPTALCNGPTCAELQGTWIANMMEDTKNAKAIEPTEEAQTDWKRQIWGIANMSLLPTTKSWYMGDNIPGKKREPLIYLGGVPAYYSILDKVAKSGYEGFTVSPVSTASATVGTPKL